LYRHGRIFFECDFVKELLDLEIEDQILNKDLIN
jgi:hypothetical protein